MLVPGIGRTLVLMVVILLILDLMFDVAIVFSAYLFMD